MTKGLDEINGTGDRLNIVVEDDITDCVGGLEGDILEVRDVLVVLERQLDGVNDDINDDVKLLEVFGVDEERGVQLASNVEPARQAAGQLHGVQEEEPREEKVPAGQSVAFIELKGQYEPAGQITGAPEKQ